jgi:hypothetical protein
MKLHTWVWSFVPEYETMRQSYDFWIYSYNASVVVGKTIFLKMRHAISSL